jgi:hypothetical protein
VPNSDSWAQPEAAWVLDNPTEIDLTLAYDSICLLLGCGLRHAPCFVFEVDKSDPTLPRGVGRETPTWPAKCGGHSCRYAEYMIN